MDIVHSHPRITIETPTVLRDIEVVIGIEIEIGIETENVVEIEIVARIEIEIVARTETEIVARTETEIVVRTETEIVARTETEIVARTETEIVVRTEIGTAGQTETEVATETTETEIEILGTAIDKGEDNIETAESEMIETVVEIAMRGGADLPGDLITMEVVQETVGDFRNVEVEVVPIFKTF